MNQNLNSVKFFIKTPNGEIAEIKEIQKVSIVSDQVVDSDFNSGQEMSSAFTWEEPENVKEKLER
ncbi:hypothetical protein EXW35_31850 (plasmid) [Bacillus mycoides]|uniref:hypothetical protein n=1 Tax=Bacillus mycoides TaxID=1405 RepID=UPI001C00ABB9|nr:hypothetical protein [Bacillus mycoides]QWG42821.1 hypothetical protein EXW35_31850 [Bacillus mycoides]